MIIAESITKKFTDEGAPITALKSVSFEIKKGEFVSIMGPSGSGKSTLLHILSFMDRPTSGVYTFFGKSIGELSDADLARIRNREMGFVFQSFNLLSRSTVYENVEMPLIYSDSPPSQRRSCIEEAIQSVGLSEKTYTEAGKLSGGQKQRVAIARALVNKPNVIFADEPTGNLDSAAGAQIMDILEKLNKGGHTIILVTHETYTAEFANRLIRLKDGEIEVDELMKKHRINGEGFFK
ncbi:MAG: ABC transporter ATP-binding protein [Patescibacteria group bacterium]